MTVEHKNITDANIHEPKNISTANDGEVYIADGAASGDWTLMHHGVFYSEATQTVTGATTWTDVALELEGVKSGLIHSTSTNPEQITCNQTGIYQISYTGNVDSSSGSSIIEMRLLVDGVEVPGSPNGGTLAAADETSVSRTLLVSLTLNEVVELQIYSDSANGQIIYAGSGATSQVTAIVTIHQVV